MKNSRYPDTGTLTLLANDPVGDWTAAAERGRGRTAYYGGWDGDDDTADFARGWGDRDLLLHDGPAPRSVQRTRRRGTVRDAFPDGGYLVTDRAEWYRLRHEAKVTGRDTLDPAEVQVRDGRASVLGSPLVRPGGDELNVRDWSRLRRR